MTEDNPLHQASAHLQTARQLGMGLRSRTRLLGIGSKKLVETIDGISDELAAAIDLVASSVAANAKQASQLDQAVTRLELVTAGDEQLIDDLAAAIETAQIELVRLERQHDLLHSRLESTD
ncbi:MAG TPA: hypothetical protein DCX77_05050 [Acidimicrobiaceae bacterium]|nr:hypothetical protein [Acidimicrobiaceae bacterium]HAX05025.1 hypothetical protein [Acidimicrobiaceae bacterium]